MSVSIVLAPPLLMDWALGVLRHRALENARWRAPLYGAPSQADKDAIAETFLRWAGEIPGVAGDVAWTPDTTLQWCPTCRVEWADPPRLVDVYNGRHDPLPADAPSAEVLRILAGRGAAFTLAEAQAEWGGAIESGLHALVAVGALYCWPVPRRGGT
jgi:hypothetical protein